MAEIELKQQHQPHQVLQFQTIVSQQTLNSEPNQLIQQQQNQLVCAEVTQSIKQIESHSQNSESTTGQQLENDKQTPMKQVSLPSTELQTSNQKGDSRNTDEENHDIHCCGLPMSPPNKNEGPWEKQEKMVIPIIILFVVFIVIGTIIGETSNDDTVKEVFRFLQIDNEDDQKIFLSFANVLLCWFLLSPVGWLVYHQKLPIEIGRKVIHIMVNLMTFVVFQSNEDLSGDEFEMKLKRKFFLSLTWYPFASIGSTFFALMKPMRKINPLANYAFHSMDRPGDRPNTLLWKSVNYCNTVITNGPYIVWCAYKGMYLLQLIPFFCIGFGDGLAEPIGRIFGKHKYYVKGLFTTKKYTRSYEGSATVFVMSLVGVLICIGELNVWQTVFLAGLLPITQTIIEAISPHTSDNGFMMIGIWGLVYIAVELI